MHICRYCRRQRLFLRWGFCTRCRRGFARQSVKTLKAQAKELRQGYIRPILFQAYQHAPFLLRRRLERLHDKIGDWVRQEATVLSHYEGEILDEPNGLTLGNDQDNILILTSTAESNFLYHITLRHDYTALTLQLSYTDRHRLVIRFANGRLNLLDDALAAWHKILHP